MKKVKLILSTFSFLFALSAAIATNASSKSSKSGLTPVEVAPYGTCLRIVGTCDNIPLPYACTDFYGNVLYERYYGVCITQARGSFMPF